MKKQQRAAIETAVRIADVEAKAEEQGSGGQPGAPHLSGVSASGHELGVSGWDFVSPHALEQEYVENIALSVSLL